MLTSHTTASKWDVARELALRLARSVREGRLEVIDGRRFVFGDPEAPLRATLRVSRPRFYRRLLLSGDLGVGEAYADGDFECDDITALATIALRNPALFDVPIARAPKRLRGALAEILATSKERQRRWVAAHYDLGNDFFASFLDDTMAYSCALFDPAHASLTEASLAKQALVCQKLALEPRDHLLDLGGGWGALAFFAARTVGCHVTTVTLSKAQHELVAARIQELGLGERMRALCADYRELSGGYDKIASIEMLEAVGHAQHETYFEVCRRLLPPRGRLLVQCITVPDDRYRSARRNAEFMKRHVFPGGCLPSEARIREVSRSFELLDRCDLTDHYVLTLRAWRERFVMQRQELRVRGYAERLLRTWEWYLGICEASFSERHTGDVQLSLSRR